MFPAEKTREKAVLVGLGGFLGSMLRYGVGGWIGRMKTGWTFPLETLAINVAGCLLIGYLAGLSESRGIFSASTRVFLFIGVLGGFTTFSTFGYEIVDQAIPEGLATLERVTVRFYRSGKG